MVEVLKIENLFARRSIRSYTSEAVSDEQLQMLLKAAMAAPSAGNRKPWHFIVVKDEQVKRALNEVHPYAEYLLEAPFGIVICGDPSLSFPDRPDYWIQDVSAATENLWLAATGLGLGAVWCGVYPVNDRVEGFRRILSVPEHVVPFALVCVGHPAEEKPPRTQYDPERVHADRW
jgi:nitroreductase